MNAKRRHWVLLAIYLLGTVVLFLAPVTEPAGLAERIPVDPDKVAHFGLIAFLAALVWWNLAGVAWRGTLAATAACAYAAIIELLQSVLPYRTGDPYDLLAGALGAVAGVSVVALASRAARAAGELRDGG